MIICSTLCTRNCLNANIYLGKDTKPTSHQKLMEHDHSFQVTALFSHLLASGNCSTPSGGLLQLTSFLAEKSKISASVVSKAGKRSLFYDFDISATWHGTSFKELKDKTEPKTMDGVIRVYNVGQVVSWFILYATKRKCILRKKGHIGISK